jgi:uncharacterized protein (DUF305 family)
MKKHESTTMHHDGENSMMDIMTGMNKKMEEMQMKGNVDHEFAEMMIIHHQAAVDMAQLQLSSGNDPILRDLSEKIISDQTNEINHLQQWLQNHPNK